MRRAARESRTAFGGAERTRAAQPAGTGRMAACERASALVLGAAKLRQLIGRYPPHTAQPAVVCGKTRIRVAGTLALPARRGAHLGAPLPVAPAQHAFHIFAGARRPMQVRR